MSEASRFSFLWKTHLVAGIIHVGSSAFLLAYTADGNTWTPPLELPRDSWVEITAGCNETLTGRCFRQDRVVETYGIELAVLCAVFAFWSGFLHLLITTPWFYGSYRKSIQQRFGWWRWLDYTVSASIMIVVIAIYCAVLDTFLLSMLGLTEATVILLGAASEWALAKSLDAEKRKRDEQQKLFEIVKLFSLKFGPTKAYDTLFSVANEWTSAKSGEKQFFKLARFLLVFAFLLFTLMWIPILTTFFLSIGSAENVPNIVYIIVFTYPLSFLFFGLVSLQIYRKRMRDYMWYEFNFILLSLVTKVLLHWSIFFALLVRGEQLENSEFERNDPGSVDEDSLYGVIGGVLSTGILAALVASWFWPTRDEKKVGVWRWLGFGEKAKVDKQIGKSARALNFW
jgi:hypothetical protein